MGPTSKVAVSSFWHGGRLPLWCWLCLKSFVDYGFGFVLYCYDEVEVPRGVQLCDARTALPFSRLFTYQKGPGAGSVAAFTNLFRYKLLHQFGGWWVDTDVLCLRSTLPPQDVVFGWESAQLLGSAVLKFPCNHWLPERLCEAAEATIRRCGADLAWGEIGPRLLTDIATEHQVLAEAAPANLFYPISYQEFALVLRADRLTYIEERTKGSSLLHLWNEMLRRTGIDRWSPPPQGSYLELMCIKHGVTR